MANGGFREAIRQNFEVVQLRERYMKYKVLRGHACSPEALGDRIGPWAVGATVETADIDIHIPTAEGKSQPAAASAVNRL